MALSMSDYSHRNDVAAFRFVNAVRMNCNTAPCSVRTNFGEAWITRLAWFGGAVANSRRVIELNGAQQSLAGDGAVARFSSNLFQSG